MNMCQDKLAAVQSVFVQKGMMQGTTTAYMTMALRGERPPPLPTIEGEGWDDHGAVMGPQVMNSIKLAVTYHKSHILSVVSNMLLIIHFPRTQVSKVPIRSGFAH